MFCLTEYEKIPCKVAACVPLGVGPGELDLDSCIPKSERRGMSLATCYTLIATKEALVQAKWHPTTEEERYNTGMLYTFIQAHTHPSMCAHPLCCTVFIQIDAHALIDAHRPPPLYHPALGTQK